MIHEFTRSSIFDKVSIKVMDAIVQLVDISSRQILQSFCRQGIVIHVTHTFLFSRGYTRSKEKSKQISHYYSAYNKSH